MPAPRAFLPQPRSAPRSTARPGADAKAVPVPVPTSRQLSLARRGSWGKLPQTSLEPRLPPPAPPGPGADLRAAAGRAPRAEAVAAGTSWWRPSRRGAPGLACRASPRRGAGLRGSDHLPPSPAPRASRPPRAGPRDPQRGRPPAPRSAPRPRPAPRPGGGRRAAAWLQRRTPSPALPCPPPHPLLRGRGGGGQRGFKRSRYFNPFPLLPQLRKSLPPPAALRGTRTKAPGFLAAPTSRLFAFFLPCCGSTALLVAPVHFWRSGALVGKVPPPPGL